MILFLNVFLTEEKFKTQGNVVRQNAKYSDKVDVFKYMLSSLSDFYSWKKVIINVKLDTVYLHRKQELHEFINNCFDKYPLIVREYRNEYQSEWKKDYDLLDDDLILFSCNHDHVFIDPDPIYFKNIVEQYRNYDDYLGIQFSHWPEHCYSSFDNSGNFEFLEDHIKSKAKCCDSIQVINRKTYHHWWVEHKLPDVAFPRADGISTLALDSFSWFSKSTIITPYREIARHFDGYQHTIWQYLPNEVEPVLEIPDGFFNNDIKINYSCSYKQNFTNINPTYDKLKIFDEKGYDFYFSKEYIPYFWKNRISEFINDFQGFASIYSEEELFYIHLTRIVNIWNIGKNINSQNAHMLRNKVIEWYKKLA